MVATAESATDKLEVTWSPPSRISASFTQVFFRSASRTRPLMCETPCLGCWLLLAACVPLSVCLKSCMHQEVLPLVDLELVLPLGPVSVIFPNVGRTAELSANLSVASLKCLDGLRAHMGHNAFCLHGSSAFKALLPISKVRLPRERALAAMKHRSMSDTLGTGWFRV